MKHIYEKHIGKVVFKHMHLTLVSVIIININTHLLD